jgi:hypothetical protein
VRRFIGNNNFDKLGISIEIAPQQPTGLFDIPVKTAAAELLYNTKEEKNLLWLKR